MIVYEENCIFKDWIRVDEGYTRGLFGWLSGTFAGVLFCKTVTCSGIGGNTSYFCLDIVGTIINPAKVNTITCLCTAALSLGQGLDDWLRS